MVARLGGAICVAAITFACSSNSASSNGIEKDTPRPVASGPGIIGVASSYNPYRKDYRSGDIETASGERYDPTAWTGAIHILYLTDYVYSEDPPDGKPADTVRDALKDVPVGTPVEEIKRASDAFGLDFNFMKAVAKIESDFDPKQRTGSYVGLFQLSNHEFAHYGARCACCGETNRGFLTIDHINNDGARLRKIHGSGLSFYRWIIKSNYPDFFQVLCYNGNFGRQRNGGHCPHRAKEGSTPTPEAGWKRPGRPLHQ
jgi:hypothetical protein